LEFGSVGTDEFEVIGGYEFRNWENNRCESVTIQYTDYRTETWNIDWTTAEVWQD
jgi:hypothetical protein